MKLVGGHAPGQLAVVHRIPGPAHQNKREAQVRGGLADTLGISEELSLPNCAACK